jgi:hypothetical protein
MMAGLPSQLPSLKHALVMLPIAALLGVALGVVRPIRRSLVLPATPDHGAIAAYNRMRIGRPPPMPLALENLCPRSVRRS